MRSSPVPPLGLLKHRKRDLLALSSDSFGGADSFGGYLVRPVESWPELERRMRTAAPSTVVLLRVQGDAEAAELRRLTGATPSVPVVAAVSFRRTKAAELRPLVAAGVAEIVNLDRVGSFEAVAPTLRRAHARPLKRRIEAGLPVWIGEEARTLVRAAAETVVDGGGRETLAGIFGVYSRTVALKCRDLGLPAPRRLLGWTRVLLALTLLEETSRTVINVALSCGYNDNSSLKRAVENFTGAVPRGPIRDQDFAGAFDRFADELRELRYGARGAAAAPPP